MLWQKQQFPRNNNFHELYDNTTTQTHMRCFLVYVSELLNYTIQTANKSSVVLYPSKHGSLPVNTSRFTRNEEDTRKKLLEGRIYCNSKTFPSFFVLPWMCFQFLLLFLSASLFMKKFCVLIYFCECRNAIPLSKCSIIHIIKVMAVIVLRG
jgi:hypothetical protein